MAELPEVPEDDPIGLGEEDDPDDFDDSKIQYLVENHQKYQFD